MVPRTPGELGKPLPLTSERIKVQRHKLEAWLVAALVRTVSGLPRATCASLMRCIGRYAYHLDARGRRVALENLDCAFGDSLSAAEKARIARQSYEGFARTMGDLFWSPALLREGAMERAVQIEGLHYLRDQSRGWIVAIPHLAGFEWISIATAVAGCTGIGVAEPFKNKLLAPIFERLRSTGGNVVHPREGIAFRFYRHLKKGGTVGVLADLSQPPGDASVIIESFGMPRSVPAIAAVLHLHTRAPILPAEPEVFADGSMRLTFGPPLEYPPDTPVFAVAQALWDLEEAAILRRPGDWMWAYKYWRHLPVEPGKKFPSYAKPSKKFEKALRSQLRRIGKPKFSDPDGRGTP